MMVEYVAMPSRRRLLAGVSGMVTATALAGCSGGGNGGTSGQQQTEDCRMVERTREENLADKLETVSAGSGWTWRFDLQEGDRLIIYARLIDDGARPALIVENPSGSTIVDTDPTTQIQRQVTAREDGRYYVKIENEAILTSGQWDMTIDLEEDYEERVCN